MLVYSSDEINFMAMRIKLCLWLLLALVPFDLFGKQELRTESDTINALIGITRIENIKGQKLSVVKKMFDTLGIPIRYFALDGTSPWIDPKGKCYVERVLISYLTLDEMNCRIRTTRTKGLVLSVIFEEPYDLEINDFEKKYYLDKENNPAQNKFDTIKDMFTIKKIECWYLDY